MDQNSTTKSNHGALIGSIVIIIILIIGGIYVVNNAKDAKYNNDAMQEQTLDDSAYQESQSMQSNSDDVSSIEADVEATNIDSLDEGL
jgi:hypothetical protein